MLKYYRGKCMPFLFCSQIIDKKNKKKGTPNHFGRQPQLFFFNFVEQLNIYVFLYVHLIDIDYGNPKTNT